MISDTANFHIGQTLDANAENWLKHERKYVRVSVGKLKSPRGDLVADGAALVEECLDPLDDKRCFPPRLFVLWATPKFKPYRSLLIGIQKKLIERDLRRVPLIGASVAGCIFDEEIYEDGAVLICIASRFVTAKATVGLEAREHPAKIVGRMADELGIKDTGHPNSRGNRVLFVFLPGYDAEGHPASYQAPIILDALRRRTRLPMFGGVSSAGLKRGLGQEFLNEGVYTDAAVVALITTDVTCGIGLSHGLEETGQTYTVQNTIDDGRTITDFVQGQAKKIIAQLPEPYLFKFRGEYGITKILQPRPVDGGISVQWKIEEGTVVQVFRPDVDEMNNAAANSLGRAIDHLHTLRNRITGLLGIFCTSFYREHEKILFDVSKMIHHFYDRFPNVVAVGCFMDGEVGLDDLGHTVFGNMGLTQMFFANDIPSKSELSLGFDILTKYAMKASRAISVGEAIKDALQAVDELGYPGGMISLTFQHHDSEWIVACHAFGKRWEKIVKPRTKCRLDGNDVLALVTKERRSRYIQDSRSPDTNCHKKTVEAANVLSQYIVPLPADEGRAIGVLQVDLGDMRDQPELDEAQTAVLDALASIAAGAITRAKRMEESDLSRCLDQALNQCMACDELETAVDCFSQKVKEAMGADMHIRLLVPEDILRLFGGIGEYVEAAREHRREIKVYDGSPSARAFVENRCTLVNDSKDDKAAVRMLRRFEDTKLEKPLNNIGSFANFPISGDNDKPIGIVNFSYSIAWQFTQSRLQSLANIGQRLYLLVNHIRQKQKEQSSHAKLKFLTEITPTPQGELHLYKALRQQTEKIKEAAGAHVVSCYLWDKNRKRFVLRAQSGWSDDQWVDAAWYDKGEGMTGKLAMSPNPCYIPNLAKFKEFSIYEKSGKYIKAMFGGAITKDKTYEVIALPLQMGLEHLGIVTMHRRRSRPIANHQTGFKTASLKILQEAADSLSAFVYSLQQYDNTRRKELETKRLNAVQEILLGHSITPQILRRVCESVLSEYRALLCAIYLGNYDQKLLCKIAHAEQKDCTCASEKDISSHNDSPIWRAFVLREVVEIRLPPARDQEDPIQVLKERIIERVCLPLLGEQSCFGVLVIGWHGAAVNVEMDLMPNHDLQYLQSLAQNIASAIIRDRIHTEQQESLKAALRAKTTLQMMAFILAGSFHDLGKGVQGIMSNLDRFDRVDKKNLKPKQAELINKCRTKARNLKLLLDRALDAGGRLTRAKRAKRRIDKLLHEALNKYQTEVDKAGIKIVTLAMDETVASVDGAQMLECFKTLIDNAVKAMPNGGSLSISLRCDPDANECRISISDTGWGMSKQEIKYALDEKPFSKENQGAGMGLALAHLYCQSHGGQLDIQSSTGTGTTVRVKIPLKEVERNDEMDTKITYR